MIERVTLVAPESAADVPTLRPARRWPRTEPIAFGILLALTGLLYLWNLSASGWANSFYSAAAQAGENSWTAMLFGSSDAANSITVDKPPAALWVIDASVRSFGLNSWSVLAPQALEGVAAVALLYAAVRRVSGPGAALLAGSVFALTPVAALMFRFNNPDALLVLLLVAGAYCMQRACEKDSSRWWLVLAGVAVGFGFLAKMLQAFLVLPAFAGAYLLAAHAPLRRRLLDVVGAGLATIAAGGWYLVLVEFWPASARPYIGGSQHNSIVELVLGYNGFGRLTGAEIGGLGNLNYDVGAGRLFGSGMGGEISWLLPAGVICIVAGLFIVGWAPRTDPTRAALVLWGGWLAVTAVAFSYANGILHPYYTVALAPAVAAGIGVGASLMWQRRNNLRVATALSGAVLISAVLACVLLARNADWLPWVRPTIAVAGTGTAALLLVVGRFNARFARAVAALAVAVCLAAPAAYSIATAAAPHEGAMPSAGPSRHWGPGVPGGPGGFLGSTEPGSELSKVLQADAADYTWVAAAIGSSSAAGYQLATGEPVMAVGGFNGTDPSPTLEQFKQYVADKRIHYFVGGKMMGPWGGATSGSREAANIVEWVEANFQGVIIDRVTAYDLTS
jgi:4-amino-4-deoxy-L-arabinose transferase-like glycosyltransferase